MEDKKRYKTQRNVVTKLNKKIIKAYFKTSKRKRCKRFLEFL